MNILNIDVKNYIPNVIEAYIKIFGEEYRDIIQERINSAKIITYRTEYGIREYVIFLENCKARELSIKFLKEIGVDVSCLEGKSYTEEVPSNIKRLISEYIGGYSGFTYLPEHNYIGIRAFDRGVQEKNKEYSEDIIEKQIEFLNFFLFGEDEEGILDKQDLEEFKKTDEYRKIYDEIQEYIKIYNRIFEEYERYSKTLEPYREFAQKRRKEEISETKEFKDILGQIGEIEESEEVLKIIFIEGKLFVTFKNVNVPILFYTIKEGGMLDYSMLHEYCHLIETYKRNGKYEGAGFDSDEEKNPYREDKRKYERLNENITDIFAIEATRILHGKGTYMLEPKELTENNTMDVNTSSITKNMLFPFLKSYKKEIIRARITGDMERLFSIIGKDNFEELNDCINRVDYLLGKGLKRSLDENGKDDKLVEEYRAQLKRLDRIYFNMKEHSIEDEER